MTKTKQDAERPVRRVYNDLSGLSKTEKVVYLREQGRLRRKKATENAKQARKAMTPDELQNLQDKWSANTRKAYEKAKQARKDMTPDELRNLQDKWSANARKAYEKAKQARKDMTPNELQNLQDKWSAKARKAYEKAKQARKDMTPNELQNLQDKWSAKARKAYEKELLCRLPNASEPEQLFARKKKEDRRKKHNKLYHSSIQRRLTAVLRSRLCSAVRNNQKAGSAIKDLGCSIDLLKNHLERNFLRGMSWENFGNKDGCWCIDHIYPISRADLTDKIQFKAVCNWNNLLPLWFTDNIKKGNAVTTESKRLFEMLRKMVS